MGRRYCRKYKVLQEDVTYYLGKFNLNLAQKSEFIGHLDAAKVDWTTKKEEERQTDDSLRAKVAANFKKEQCTTGRQTRRCITAIQAKCQNKDISCVPLVQSSGWRKTRSLMQLAVSDLCHIMLLYLHVHQTKD